MQKVLVTGATGFIGRSLCQYLYEKGFQIRAMSRTVCDSALSDQYEWVSGDITQPASLLGLCDGVDIVFHLAGFAHAEEEKGSQFRKQHEAINYHGTMHILNESERAGVKRFVYFSSVKAVAECDNCTDESWDKMPSDAYGIAKRQAEAAVLKISKNPIILRPTLVYGLGVKGNLSAMIKAISRGYFPTPPPIQNHKSMVSLADLCRAAVLAAQVENPLQKIYIVSDGVAYSTFQIHQMILAALGKRKVELYLPLFIWNGLAKIGDILQKIIHRRLPMSSVVFKKLFSNAAYCSQYAKNE